VVTEHVVLSQPQANDRRYRSTFPALNSAGWPIATVASIEGRFRSTNCPSEQNGWTGQNYGCYTNPAADQMIDRLKAVIDPEDQRRPYQELARLQTEELPFLPLFFNINLTVFRQGITGVKGDARPEGGVTWNIAEWDIDW